MEKMNIEDIELYNKLSDKIFEVAKETFNYIMEKYPYLLQGDEPELYDFYLTNDKLVLVYGDIENDINHYWECPLTHVIEGTTMQYVDNWGVEEKTDGNVKNNNVEKGKGCCEKKGNMTCISN